MKRLSPVIEGYNLSQEEKDKIKEPLRIKEDELKRLTIEICGYPFLAFGNAILCPKCGVQQGILCNVAPDGETNFYLNFKCDDYKEMEKAKELKAIADEAPSEPQTGEQES